MQNVEFKCELRDIQLARLICKQIGAQHIDTIKQVDTYYRVPDGRLKKRETDGDPPEFIFYHRVNRAQPKLSHFTIYSEEEAKSRYGERALPVWLRVIKTREIWFCRSCRIHLDQIEGLGAFFEIEALVSPSQHVGMCHRVIAKLREQFALALGEPVATSYSDMVALDQEDLPS